AWIRSRRNDGVDGLVLRACLWRGPIGSTIPWPGGLARARCGRGRDNVGDCDIPYSRCLALTSGILSHMRWAIIILSLAAGAIWAQDTPVKIDNDQVRVLFATSKPHVK